MIALHSLLCIPRIKTTRTHHIYFFPPVVRESAAKDKVLAAHRKVMIANHPDAGGSDYIATKINEAKAKLIKKGGSGSPF